MCSSFVLLDLLVSIAHCVQHHASWTRDAMLTATGQQSELIYTMLIYTMFVVYIRAGTMVGKKKICVSV